MAGQRKPAEPDWTPADRDRDMVSFPERMAAGHRELFPVLTPEEDQAIARRTGRKRKVVRCRRGHAHAAGVPCWRCAMLADDAPTRPNLREPRKRGRA